jgi:hypothetical protein
MQAYEFIRWLNERATTKAFKPGTGLNIAGLRGYDPFAGGQCWLVKIDRQTLQTLIRFL